MGTCSELGNLIKIYWALLLGNIVEWYEYAVYGYLATQLERSFFRGSHIAVWLGFGVTFLARPLGGILLGALGDTWGRSFAVNVSIVGMIVGTVGQGCLPTYASGSDLYGFVGMCGLVVLRLVQGLSTAGEISTIATYLFEVGPQRTLGRLISLINVTGNLGFLLAQSVVYAVRAALGDEAFEAWGWRLPFLAALLPGLVAVWGRRGAPESGLFLQQRQAAGKGGEVAAAAAEVAGRGGELGEKTRTPPSSMQTVRDTAVAHWPNLLIGASSVACFAILQYGAFVWIQSFLAHRGMPAGDRAMVGVCARGLMTLLTFFVGWLTDVVGVGSVMLVAGLGTAVLGLPLWVVLESDPTSLGGALLALGVGLAILGAFVGTPVYLFVVELFPTAVRNTAVGISYNVGFALFGGLAPAIAEACVEWSPYGPGLVYAAGGAITATAVAVGLLLQRRGVIQMVHVRPDPYFVTGCRGTNKARAATSSS